MVGTNRDLLSFRRYFYLNGTLYRRIATEPRINLLYAERVSDEERVTFLHSDVKKNAQRAFPTHAVSKMLGIKSRTLNSFWQKGWAKKPDNNGITERRGMRYLYSEDDVLAIYDLMAQTHHGKPRRDGRITIWHNMPSRAELVAKLRGEDLLYYRDTDGNFRPVWKSEL